MKYSDKVYGQVEINEPVILKIMASKPLLRIKDVNQAGTQLVQPNKRVTRFDHCVGVMIILKKFGASLEEQIAGLLHDVPHTAFSHAADFVFKEGDSQEYHEKFLKKIVLESEIPEILKEYQIDPEFVTDEHNFSLLEQDIPLLCADRIDYSLRDMENDGNLNQEEIEQILKFLGVRDGIFVMTDIKTALFYARNFMKQCLTSWNFPQTLASFEFFGQTIRRAFEIGQLTEEDLFGTDTQVLNKLRAIEDEEIQSLLKKQNPNLEIIFDEANFDFDTRGKVRYIDPPITTAEGVKSLSKIDKNFASEIEKFKKEVVEGYRIRVV